MHLYMYTVYQNYAMFYEAAAVTDLRLRTSIIKSAGIANTEPGSQDSASRFAKKERASSSSSDNGAKGLLYGRYR